MRNLRTLQDVVAWRLCIGCGACAAACDYDGITMEHVPEQGFRPRLSRDCASCSVCLPFCPGYGVAAPGEDDVAPDVADFGPARAIWEGWATDTDVRRRGSSGGVLTALALFAVEAAGFAGVVQTSMDPDDPLRNRTVISRSRAEILSCCGSRYNASSPVEGLRRLRQADGTYLFIGKPCDAAAVMEMRRALPWVNERVGLVAAFFCAGTPTPEGTRRLVERLGGDPDEVEELHYRGRGWPGEFRFRSKSGENRWTRLSYEESWGFLTSFRPLRCRLCPDGTGQAADLVCADAWHRFDSGAPDGGRSLVLARSEAGEDFVRAAWRAGRLTLEKSDRPSVSAAQPSLLDRRRDLWGRLAALRCLGIPTPRYQGFGLRRSWRQLPWRRRLRVFLGTLRRALLRAWWRPSRVFAKAGSAGPPRL